MKHTLFTLVSFCLFFSSLVRAQGQDPKITHPYTYADLKDSFVALGDQLLRGLIIDVNEPEKEKKKVFAYDLEAKGSEIYVYDDQNTSQGFLIVSSGGTPTEMEKKQSFLPIAMNLGVTVTYDLSSLQESLEEEGEEQVTDDDGKVLDLKQDTLDVTLTCGVEELFDLSSLNKEQDQALIKVYPGIKECKGSLGARVKLINAIKKAGKYDESMELPSIYPLTVSPEIILEAVDCTDTRFTSYKHDTSGQCLIFRKA
ncbi:MAG: hypothetical protein KDD52_06135 [Bdellovibrionales bacterium]|nr:hypothetical protein [Bdellovibrionales bacterium]